MSHPSDDNSKFISYPGHSIGLRNVGSYQVSGHPYLTGSVMAADSEVMVQFPFVTRTITLIASGTSADLRAHWAPQSAGNVMGGKHYITLNSSKDALTVSVKCSEMYVSCVGAAAADTGFEIFAELTNIGTNHMYALTGSGLTD